MSVKFCQQYFGFPDETLSFMSGKVGVDFLAHLFDRGEMYESPYNILRQELYWHNNDARNVEPFLKKCHDVCDVLDYGCGAAGYMRSFIDAGHNVYLYETSKIAIEYLNAKYGDYENVRIVQDLDDLDSLTFDRILCLDVLEHVENPRDVAAYLAERLSPNGEMLTYFSRQYPHPGHLLESIRQFEATMKDLRDVLTPISASDDWCLIWWRNDQ